MTTTADPPALGDGSSDPRQYVGEEMTLVEHLEELRSRLFKSALAIALAFAVGFSFHERILELLSGPYCELPARLRGLNASGECTLYILDVTGGFFVALKASAMVAVVLSAPFVCYQIWRFITPGLRPVERRYSVPFIVISQVLFAAGAVFSYFLIPRALEFLLGFGGDSLVSVIDAGRYVSFVLMTMIAFGVTFEFPLVLIILSLMDVVHSYSLSKWRRHAIFGMFAASAVITPSQDPATMVFMAAPLIVFYEISIVVARFIERGREQQAPVTT